ncbi:hypothetical protein BH23GEM7_BH23GEM7_27190 [soil metagenome]|jgi:hypothetical protein
MQRYKPLLYVFGALFVLGVLASIVSPPPAPRPIEVAAAAPEAREPAPQPKRSPITPGAGRANISRTDYGDRWPLTVESGRLECRGAGAVVFVQGGREYAVNGMAKSAGARDIDPIWRADPSDLGYKVNIGPLIDDGLKLCRR